MSDPAAWTGFEVDDADGTRVGRVHGAYLDADGGEPVWLVLALGRRGAKKVAVPMRECASAAGRVWIAQPREALRDAPAVDPSRPLLREHEAAICAHYGVGAQIGRHAEIAAREDGEITAHPA